MKGFYAGIGSRETPESVLGQMTELASFLEKEGWWLRSGNADGADQAFALGVETNAQIWLPWDSFNKDFKIKKPKHTYKVIDDGDEHAFDSVKRYHPNGVNLKPAVQRLMARNFRQVAGVDERFNSSFVVCWTKDGKDSGGTGQAIRMSYDLGIPVFNLFNLTPEQIIGILSPCKTLKNT